MSFKLFQFALNATNGTLSNTTDTSEETSSSDKYLWFLILDLLIFMGLTYQTYSSSKKLNTEQENPEDFRPKFIKWLVLANGVRTLSLIFIIAFGNPNGNNATSWLNAIFHVGPAFLFVSSYMYLATFLGDLYYSNIEYNNHLMKPALVLIVSGGYCVLVILALVTFIFSAYSAFYFISEFLMALLYLVLGSLTIYYGRQVSLIFKSRTQNQFDSSNEMSSKLTILSYSIGGLFLLKGLSGLLTGITILDPTKYPNIYDFFWFLILEIAPTVIFIYVGKKKDPNVTETPRQSSVYEMEYSNRDSSRPSNSYRPPFVN